jgi:hypothetical protein
LILHNLIIRIEEELELNDTTEWARNDCDHEDYAEGQDYGGEEGGGGEGEEGEETPDHNDPDTVAGKEFREYLAMFAQHMQN